MVKGQITDFFAFSVEAIFSGSSQVHGHWYCGIVQNSMIVVAPTSFVLASSNRSWPVVYRSLPYAVCADWQVRKGNTRGDYSIVKCVRTVRQCRGGGGFSPYMFRQCRSPRPITIYQTTIQGGLLTRRQASWFLTQDAPRYHVTTLKHCRVLHCCRHGN